MRLIDADKLYEQLKQDEEMARNRVLDTESTSPYPNNLNPSYTRYVAQMDERTRLKHMVTDAPTIESERTKYIQDTKAVPSDRDCVDLSEKVTATFYDDEPEEWLQMTVTIRDVLDSVCDSYTVIKLERKTGKWIPHKSIFGGLGERVYTCDQCGHNIGFHMENYCPNCGSQMIKGGQE